MYKRLKAAPLRLKAGVVALGLVTAVPVVQAGEDWFLMGRNGQCMEMGTLFAKMPDLAQVKTPQQYIAIMEAKGNQMESSVSSDAKGKTYRVRVPAKGLTLTFVEPGVCPL